MTASRPNILLITSDHMRQDALSCFGNTVVSTPTFERLASTGVRFTHCYTPNPVCVPARATITTGNYPHRCTGVTGNGGRILDDQPKLAQVFANAGYRTYALGKLHYEPYSPPGERRLLHGFQTAEITEEGRAVARFDREGHLRGIEDYHDYLHDVGWGGYERAHGIGNNDIHPAPSPVPEEHYVDTWVASRTLHHLREHQQYHADTPFLTWMSFTKPHSPYDPPEPYHRYYDPRNIPAPVGTVQDLSTRNPVLRFARGHHGWGGLSPEGVQVARAHYYGMVTFQDLQISRVLDHLEETGQRENTVIIYTSDHGDLLGDFGCFFKGNFLNGSARIPFLVSAPGMLPEGEERQALVGLQDILPTLCSLTGVKLDAEVQGEDLSPALKDSSHEVRDYFYGQHGDGAFLTHMVANQKRKYIYTIANGTEELYDLESDPDELHNLAPEATTMELQPWRDRLIAWIESEGIDGVVENGQLRAEEIDIPDDIPFSAGSMGWRWY